MNGNLIKRGLLSGALLLGLGFAALPASAHSGVSVGIQLGSPYYYYEPRPVYHHYRVYRPAYRSYYYDDHYCPPGHYHRHHRGDHRRYWRDRDWDDYDD